jgi:hypothetical protein
VSGRSNEKAGTEAGPTMQAEDAAPRSRAGTFVAVVAVEVVVIAALWLFSRYFSA